MPEVKKERGKKGFEGNTDWGSELWHVDCSKDGSFKIFICCNKVTEDNAAFEIMEPVVCYKYNEEVEDPDSHLDTRFEDIMRGKKFTCEAFISMIFNPNCIHKGNYSRKGYRDAIMLGFEQR